MKLFVKIISALLVLIMCIAAVGCGGDGKGEEGTMKNDNPVIEDARTKVGDKIVLGKYEQNGDLASAEDISWTVIKVEEGRALLIADLCLAHGGFHDAYEAFSWADSSIRDWLNVDFYTKAFNDEEKTLIRRTSIENDKNYKYTAI